MRRRFPVSGYLTEFPIALLEKQKFQEENPGKHYQIRKSDKRGFRVVERLETNESEVIQELRSGRSRRRKRRTPMV